MPGILYTYSSETHQFEACSWIINFLTTIVVRPFNECFLTHKFIWKSCDQMPLHKMQETPDLLCYFGEHQHKNEFWDAWKSNYGSWITASTFSWYFMHENASDRYEIGCRCDDYVLEAYSSVSTDYRKIFIRSVLVTLSPLREDACIFWCSDWNDPLMMDTWYRNILERHPHQKTRDTFFST